MAVARENAQHDILQKSYQRPDPVRGDQRRQLGLKLGAHIPAFHKNEKNSPFCARSEELGELSGDELGNLSQTLR